MSEQQKSAAASNLVHRYLFIGKAKMTANGRVFLPGQQCHAIPGTDTDRWYRDNKAFKGPELMLPGAESAASEAIHAAEIDRRKRDQREAELLAELQRQSEQASVAQLAKEQVEQASQAREAELQAEIERLQAEIEAAKVAPTATPAPADSAGRGKRK